MKPTLPQSVNRQLRLLAVYAWANFRRNTIFRVSLLLEQSSYLVQLVISLVLWKYLFTRLPRFEGWTFDAILVLHLFGNLFLALFHSVFMGCHTLWGAIQNGLLDSYLVRPVDPRWAHLASCVRPEELLNRLLAQVPLVLYLASRGVELEPARVAVGLAVMLLGLCAFSCIQLTVCALAFWVPRGDAILSFLDLFYGFYRFPLNALSWTAQLVIALFAPVVLAVTYPALFATGGSSPEGLALVTAATLAVLAVWWGLQRWVWRRGLAAYQSPAG